MNKLSLEIQILSIHEQIHVFHTKIGISHKEDIQHLFTRSSIIMSSIRSIVETLLYLKRSNECVVLSLL